MNTDVSVQAVGGPASVFRETRVRYSAIVRGVQTRVDEGGDKYVTSSRGMGQPWLNYTAEYCTGGRCICVHVTSFPDCPRRRDGTDARDIGKPTRRPGPSWTGEKRVLVRVLYVVCTAAVNFVQIDGNPRDSFRSCFIYNVQHTAPYRLFRAIVLLSVIYCTRRYMRCV